MLFTAVLDVARDFVCDPERKAAFAFIQILG